MFFFSFAGAGGSLISRRSATLELSEQFADLEEIRLQCVNESSSLSVLRRSTDGNATIFDDIANAESIAGSWPKSKLSEGRIATIRGRKDCRVKFIPTCIGEEGRH